jgi:hypothetical protein
VAAAASVVCLSRSDAHHIRRHLMPDAADRQPQVSRRTGYHKWICGEVASCKIHMVHAKQLAAGMEDIPPRIQCCLIYVIIGCAGACSAASIAS